ncbi:MAG: hypothetical protein PXX83_02785 [Candidatus Nitrosotalea sp.]|nr:hypothetical protein [Candidatus Nitrosotalea sp.]
MEKAKDHFWQYHCTMHLTKRFLEQDNNRIVSYWHFASDRFVLLVWKMMTRKEDIASTYNGNPAVVMLPGCCHLL